MDAITGPIAAEPATETDWLHAARRPNDPHHWPLIRSDEDEAARLAELDRLEAGIYKDSGGNTRRADSSRRDLEIARSVTARMTRDGWDGGRIERLRANDGDAPTIAVSGQPGAVLRVLVGHAQTNSMSENHLIAGLVEHDSGTGDRRNFTIQWFGYGMSNPVEVGRISVFNPGRPNEIVASNVERFMENREKDAEVVGTLMRELRVLVSDECSCLGGVMRLRQYELQGCLCNGGSIRH